MLAVFLIWLDFSCLQARLQICPNVIMGSSFLYGRFLKKPPVAMVPRNSPSSNALNVNVNLDLAPRPNLQKQQQHRYQNHRKITYKKPNFLCVCPLLVLRPDWDSSQDSRKVSQGIFLYKKSKKLTKLYM